jgi:hypothetical protein
LHVKNDDKLLFIEKYMELKDIILDEISQTQKVTHVLTYMRNLKILTRNCSVECGAGLVFISVHSIHAWKFNFLIRTINSH